MKTHFILCCIFYTLNGFSQPCDTLRVRSMNITDSDGMKQGYWETWQYQNGVSCVLIDAQTTPEQRATIHEQNFVLETCGCYQDDHKTGEWKSYFPWGQLKSKGNYQHGQKLGEWQYFISYQDTSVLEKNTNYILQKGVSVVEHQILYTFENDSLVIKQEEGLGDGFKWVRIAPNTYFELSPDCLEISGETQRNGVQVTFHCDDGSCCFHLPNNIELFRSSFSSCEEFDMQLHKLRLGMYDWEIKLKMN